MSNKSKDKEVVKEIHLKQNLSPIWVDNINIGVREDGICFLRFMTRLPEGVVEQVQLMTSKEHIKKFIEVLSSSIKYTSTKNDSND